MRILILALNFPPDGVSTAHLMGELAESLSLEGHEVAVTTTTPHQAVDPIAAEAQPIRRRPWSVVGHSQMGPVRVRHILMPRKARRSATRIMQWMWFHLASTIVGWSQPRPDVIITPSPPLTIGLNAWLIGRFGRTPILYNVQELYPDVAVQLGYVTNKRIIALLKRLERLVYRLANAVVVIAPGMAISIEEDGAAPSSKVHVVPNFVDTNTFRPSGKDNTFARTHDLADKFVVSYAGNMGPAQRLDEMVDAAGLLSHRTDIHFLLVGEGSEWERLRGEIRRQQLNNVTILPYQPYEIAPLIYASSDLCVVPLDSTLIAEALPSKVYKIMSTGRPVLALTMEHSSLAAVVHDAKAGIVVPPGETKRLAEVVSRAADDPASMKAFGERGRSYVLAHLSRKTVMKAFSEVLTSIIPDPRG